jgi:hypothetical protein
VREAVRGGEAEARVEKFQDREHRLPQRFARVTVIEGVVLSIALLKSF